MFTWVDVCSTQPLCCGIQSAFRRVTHQRPRRRRRVYFGHFVTTQRIMGGPNRYSTACGLPHPASGRRTSAYLTGAPRRRRPSRCPPFHAHIPPATSTDCQATSDGGRARRWFPGLRPGADGRCASRLHSPEPSPAVLGAPLPAMLIVRSGDGVPSSAGNGACSGRWSLLPPSRPRRRSNSDHAGKSTYSGEIESLDQDPGIATLVPRMPFPGN